MRLSRVKARVDPTDPMIALDGVSRRYGAVAAVDDVSLRIE